MTGKSNKILKRIMSIALSIVIILGGIQYTPKEEVKAEQRTYRIQALDLDNNALPGTKIQMIIDGRSYSGIANVEGFLTVNSDGSGDVMQIQAESDNLEEKITDISAKLENYSLRDYNNDYPLIRAYEGQYYISVFLAPNDKISTISGTVTDIKVNTPVSGAKVKLNKDGKSTNKETVTDEDGKYSFNVFDLGEYTISVSKDDFVDYNGTDKIKYNPENGVNNYILNAAIEPYSITVSGPTGNVEYKGPGTSFTVSNSSNFGNITYNIESANVIGVGKIESIDFYNYVSCNNSGNVVVQAPGTYVISAGDNRHREECEVTVTAGTLDVSMNNTDSERTFTYSKGFKYEDEVKSVLNGNNQDIKNSGDIEYKYDVYYGKDNNIKSIDTKSFSLSETDISNNGIIPIGKFQVMLTVSHKKGWYEQKKISYNIQIDKITPSFDFTNDLKNIDEFIANAAGYTITCSAYSSSGGAITYEVESEKNGIASIQEENKLEVICSHNIGQEFTVKATTKGNDYYFEKTISKTFKIVEKEIFKDEIATLFGDKINEQGEWFVYLGEDSALHNSKVNITPKNSEFEISYDLSAWSDSLEYEIGGDNDVTYYLKDSDGAISSAKKINIKLDTKEPENVVINTTIKQSSIFDFITNGQGIEQEVKLEATDTESGIDHFEVSINSGIPRNVRVVDSQGKEITLFDGNSGVKSFTINANSIPDTNGYSASFKFTSNFKGNISIVAVDKAGYKTSTVDNTYYSVDTTQSDFVHSLPQPVSCEDKNGLLSNYNDKMMDSESVFYYSTKASDVVVSINITDENENFIIKNVIVRIYNLGNNEVTTLPSNMLESEDIVSDNSDKQKVWFSLNGEGRYQIEYFYGSLLTKNQTYQKTPIIVINNQAPVGEVSLADAVNVANSDGQLVSSETSEAEYYYYKSANNAKVTFKVEDTEFHAGDVQISYSKNGSGFTSVDMSSLVWKEKNGGYEVTVNPTYDGVYVYKLDYTNRSGNTILYTDKNGIEHNNVISPYIVVDSVDSILNPVLSNPFKISYTLDGKEKLESADDTLTDQHKADTDAKYYYNGSGVTVIINIEETNFYSQDVVIKDNNITTGIESTIDINNYEWSADGDNHSATVALEEYGIHKLTVTYKDRSSTEEKKYESAELYIDGEKPINGEISFSDNYISNNDSDQKILYYGKNNFINVTFDVEDEMSGVEYVEWTFTPSDNKSDKNASQFNGVISYNELTDGKYQVVIPQYNNNDIQLDGKMSFTATDRSGNKMDEVYNLTELIRDTIKPIPAVEFNNKPEQVVRKNGYIVVENDDNNFQNTRSDGYMCYYMNEKVAFKLSIDEANFDGNVVVKDNFILKTSLSSDTYNPLEVVLEPSGEWTKDGDMYSNTYEIAQSGTHVITITYTDLSGNEMEPFITNEIILDVDVPVLADFDEPTVVADNPMVYTEPTNIVNNSDGTVSYYYGKSINDITVDFNVYDDNSGVQTLNWTFDKTVDSSDVNKDSFRDSIYSVDKNDKYHISLNDEVRLSDDDVQLDGKFSFSAIDRAGNEVKDIYDNIIIIRDTKVPVAKVDIPKPVQVTGVGNGSMSYYDSDSLDITVLITEANFDGNVTVTDFYKYYDDESGKYVNSEIVYNKNNFSNYTVVTNDDGKDTDDNRAIYTIRGNGEHYFTIEYTDPAGNEMEKYVSNKFILDNEAPKDNFLFYSTEVSQSFDVSGEETKYYSGYITVTIKSTDIHSGVEKIDWFFTKTEESSEVNIEKLSGTLTSADIIMNNNGVCTYIITIPFRANDLSSAQQLNGKVSFIATDRSHNSTEVIKDNVTIVRDTIAPTRTVTLPKPSQIVDMNTYNTKENKNGLLQNVEKSNSILYYNKSSIIVNFEIEEANYDGTLVLSDNGEAKKYDISHSEGDKYIGSYVVKGVGEHIITLNYTDPSGNEMKKYESQKIVLDNVKPEIYIEFPEGSMIDGTDNFYSSNTVVTFTVRDENFRAEDVEAVFVAKDSAGKVVSIEDFASVLKDRGSWTQKKDYFGKYNVAKIKLVQDANYTISLKYTDLATNSKSNNNNTCTVDRKSPSNLKVTYSNSVLDTVLNNVSFGFYKAPVTVTISAVDETSGVVEFDYEALLANNVSSVNKAIVKKKVKEAKITQDGNVFTIKFTIPQDMLGANNQFNGNVGFEAIDRAKHSTTEKETKTVVVDNIAPVINVTYNDAVSKSNGVSYYDGNVECTININEANFYSSDVVVSVTKNGTASGVRVNWSDISADAHQGTFSLSDDGDYIVNISYVDKSSNAAIPYNSEKITIDKKKPTISVSNIVNESANNVEEYGFVIRAEDQNFIASNFVPELTRVGYVNGAYVSEKIQLGDVVASNGGKTLTINVKNIEKDGLYTLKASAVDNAKNSYSKIRLDDGKEYDEVYFSINRNGSVFILDDTTQNAVERYYLYGVPSDIVIKEINVNPISNCTIKVNGTPLTEGVDYTVSDSGTSRTQWVERVYTVKQDIFAKEGEYAVTIETVDQTGANAFSDMKGLDLTFVVDQTAPKLTISGLETNGRYKKNEQEVIVGVSDDGGKVYSFNVKLLDSKGEEISELFNMEGEELTNYLIENGNKVSFMIPNGFNNQVVITCNDYVGENADGKSNVYSFKNVTVSENSFVLYYANTPLFIGTIIFLLLLIAAIIAFVVKKKK